MNMDNIQIEVLEDGTISVTTDQVSGANHMSADKLLKELAEVLGGPVAVKKRSKFHLHGDLSGKLHEHASDGHVHQH
jgi:hypothetical protein